MGIARNDFPTCSENSRNVHILVDDHSGVCRINQKRVDGEWGPWKSEDIVDTTSDYKEFEARQLVLQPGT